jgi:hypothetical protein
MIYGAVSYGGLVLINNSELHLANMWIAYLPMFIGVYVLTQWLDRKIVCVQGSGRPAARMQA